MTWFDYKVVPAPRRMKRARGVSDHADLFALTLTEAINEHARQGWEYVRAETLSAETPGGWLRRGRLEEETVLVFRRARETLAPRLERGEAPMPAPAMPAPAMPAPREPEGSAIPQWVEPIRPEAAPARPPAPPLPPLRREPVVEDAPAPQPRRPLMPQPDPHPGPRLGPAERG